MRSEWLAQCIRMSHKRADFFSGARKIIRNVHFTMDDIRGRIEGAATSLGTDVESVTGKFRTDNGNLTMEQMWELPVDKVYGFARQLVQYAAQQEQAAASREHAPDA